MGDARRWHRARRAHGPIVSRETRGTKRHSSSVGACQRRTRGEDEPSDDLHQQPPVDASSVVTDAARQSGLPFDAPVGLPDGWSATNARYASSTDGLPTWQAGWSTPKGGYVAIRQTKTASPGWLQAATSGGRQTGTTDIAGRTWTRYYDAENKRTSLVWVPSGADTATSMATVITAIADDDEIVAFTTAQKPTQTR